MVGAGRRAVMAAAMLGIAGRGAIAFADTLSKGGPQGGPPGGPPGGRMTFRMVRHGDEIGRHNLVFERQGDAMAVHTSIDAVVTLLSVPIYRYRHRASETWSRGALNGLVSETDKNDEKQWAKASRGVDGLAVTGSQTRPYLAPSGAMPASYWNRQMLDGPMISLEDGVLLRPKIEPLGAEAVKLASGARVPGEHFRLSGAFAADVFYERNGDWAGLVLSVPDGSEIRYERL